MARGAADRTAPGPRRWCTADRHTLSRWPARVVEEAYRRWLAAPGRLAVRPAWYWHAAGDLDESARYAERARRLAARHPAVPVTLVADVALTAARIARDRD